MQDIAKEHWLTRHQNWSNSTVVVLTIIYYKKFRQVGWYYLMNNLYE